jgi:hypothetical protein
VLRPLFLLSAAEWELTEREQDTGDAELQVRSGIGHRKAGPLMSPRWLRRFSAAWWALLSWSVLRRIVRGVAGRGARPGQPGRPGCPPDQVRPAQQAPRASPPAAQAHRDSPPTARTRVVLLPHTPIIPTDTRSHNRRTPEGPPP